MAAQRAPRRRRRWIVLAVLLAGVWWYIRSRSAGSAGPFAPRSAPPSLPTRPPAEPVPAGEFTPPAVTTADAGWRTTTAAPVARDEPVAAPAPAPVAALAPPARPAPAGGGDTASRPSPRPKTAAVRPSPRPRPRSAQRADAASAGGPDTRSSPAGTASSGAPAGPGGAAPGPEYTIKGNAGSMLFHTPESPYYARTKAEVWFRTPEEAVAAGFTAWVPKRAR